MQAQLDAAQALPADGGPLTISLPGQECQISVEELTTLPAQYFDALWKVS